MDELDAVNEEADHTVTQLREDNLRLHDVISSLEEQKDALEAEKERLIVAANDYMARKERERILQIGRYAEKRRGSTGGANRVDPGTDDDEGDEDAILLIGPNYFEEPTFPHAPERSASRSKPSTPTVGTAEKVAFPSSAAGSRSGTHLQVPGHPAAVGAVGSPKSSADSVELKDSGSGKKKSAQHDVDLVSTLDKKSGASAAGAGTGDMSPSSASKKRPGLGEASENADGDEAW
ncbi:unnamed protein product, partial [Amoebophrya sp. A25]|eukprot:GSA25T00014347001.1